MTELMGGGAQNCPPVGLTTVTDFDLVEYQRATWYVQEQQVNGVGTYTTCIFRTLNSF
jgi:hypothetical protein